MRSRLIWLTCAAWAIGIAIATAQSLAFAPTTHTTVAGARGAVSVDLNRDGWPDIATANVGRNTVAILLNRGAAGGFLPAREIAVGAGPFDIAAGDLNRDGVPDLAVVTPSAPGVEVLLLNADATLKSRAVVSTVESRGVTIADVNRDGALDVVFSAYAANRVVALPGDGAGGFRPTLSWPVGSRPQGVTAADFNHDGFMDIAVALSNSLVLTVLHGTATTSVNPRNFSAGRTLNVLTAVDINADGWLDIAAASTSTNVVSLFKGSATGFVLAGTRATGSSPRGITSGDFNHDGRPDLTVSNRGSSSVTVFLARRDGSVLPDRWGELPAGSGARGVVAGDFDNDGRSDMAAAAELSPALTMFANDTAFVRAGFSFRRQALPEHRFATGGLAHADFNEDGRVDLVRGREVLLDGGTNVTLDLGSSFAGTYDVQTADYNRDGHADIVMMQFALDTATRTTLNTVQVWHGDGRGAFARGARLGPFESVGLLRLGDVDRDGRIDIVIDGATSAGARLYIARQTSSGHIVSEILMQSRADQLELADVNRDGILDVVTWHMLQALEVRHGNGAGGFGEPTQIIQASELARFDIADLNHDGRVDIAVGVDNDVAVILATPSGGWSGAVRYRTAPPDVFDSVLAVRIADFTADGHPDVFASNGALLPGRGDGTFGPPDEFVFGPLFAIRVDLNRDGLPDFVYDAEAILNERRAVNRPPIANAGPDGTFRYQFQFAQDDGTLGFDQDADPDFHEITAEWRDETGAVFGRGQFVNIPVKQPGTYTYTLTLRDGHGGESTDEFQVTILPEEEIVLYTRTSGESSATGNWREVADTTAAEGIRLVYPNAGAPKVTTPLANPASFLDLTVVVDPTQTYKLWVRLKAQDNRGSNDSIWVQFSGAVDTAGNPNYRIGTTEGLAVNLEECLGCGVSGWGWEDDGWGAINKNGTLLRFPQGGFQQIRIQVREDGVSVDQVVLSAVKYRTTRPGTAKNDTTILDKTQHFPE